MDGRGGGCIARYSGSNSSYGEITYGMSKVERIMLKFRPIAPKPMAAGSGSSCSTVEHSDGSGGNPRRKRRYVRVNNNNNNKKKKNNNTNPVSKKRKLSVSTCDTDKNHNIINNSGGGHGGVTVVTLALMPETPDRKENSPATSSPGATINNKKRSPVLLSFNSMQSTTARDGHVIVSPKPQKLMVTSLVTVECVKETWMNGDGVGLTDQARIISMEMDTCPSFITNSRDTVVWTNKAYREMITGSDNYSDEMVMVVVKKFNRVTLPVCHPSFTCTVKVTWGAPVTVTAPCDLWRLRNGGYAWRLDVKAALSLGRYS